MEQSSVYKPLPDGTAYIRLLQFASGQDNEIKCRMTTHRLDDSPPYAALSYTWGETSAAESILVNDTPLACRSNCYYVLWQVRRFLSRLVHSASRDGTPLLRTSRRRFMLENVVQYSYIWIDSICINQDDLYERGLQVSIMGDIYKIACQVLVGLGPEDESCRAVASLLGQPLDASTLLGLSPEAYSSHAHSGYLPYSEREEELLEALDTRDPLCAYLISLMHHLATLGQRRYWVRVWVVQEYALSARNPCALLGYALFSFQALYRLGMNLSEATSA